MNSYTISKFLCSGKSIHDGKEVIGYPIEIGDLYSAIIPLEYLEHIAIRGLNEETLKIKCVRVLKKSLTNI